jgi:hypothetical protein
VAVVGIPVSILKGLVALAVLVMLAMAGTMLWVLRDLPIDDAITKGRDLAIALEAADGKPLGRVGRLKLSDASREEFPKQLVLSPPAQLSAPASSEEPPQQALSLRGSEEQRTNSPPAQLNAPTSSEEPPQQAPSLRGSDEQRTNSPPAQLNAPTSSEEPPQQALSLRGSEEQRTNLPPAQLNAPASSEEPPQQALCDYRACAPKYQSFSAADCTYQPYGGGPRRLCEKTTSSARIVSASEGTGQPKQGMCNYDACAQIYSSFRREDCTYQPYDGGPRRLCQR